MQRKLEINKFMRMTGCLLCLLGFLTIAVGAQAQCSTPPCIASITITPSAIPGDGATTATATITVNRGLYIDVGLDVGIGSSQFTVAPGFRCLPPAVFDYNSGTESSPANCSLPNGVSTLQIELLASNPSQTPDTGQVSAASCVINSMS